MGGGACQERGGGVFEKELIPQCTLCIISSLTINKTSARFSTSNKILILLKKNISKQLAELFNLSFLSGSFPCILKTTKVVPVFKKDSKLDYCNYHTILQYTQYNLQFGFRQKISTSHALNNITERLTRLTKGLSRVDHEILLSKLDCYGVHGISNTG